MGTDFCAIINAIPDAEDRNLKQYLNDFYADIDADIERHDWAKYREAQAIRQATTVLWQMAYDGWIASFNYGDHPRADEWHQHRIKHRQLNASIRGESLAN